MLFISLEVVSQAYLFLPDSSNMEHLMNMIDESIPSPSDPVSFTYNPLHDLESIWWIATSFIFQYFTIDGHDRQQLDEDVDKLFPTTQLSSRHAAFTYQPRYEQMISHLPTELQKHGQTLNLLRRGLLNAYKFAESDLGTIKETSLNEPLYKLLRTAFQSLQKDYRSLAASLNKPQKQSSAAGREEVGKRSSIKSSPSAGQRKMANKQPSMSDTMPRRSTRSRRAVVYEQLAESDDDEDFEYAKTSKRRKVDDGGDDQGYTAVESSQSARRQEKMKEREGDENVDVAESSHLAKKCKEINEDDLEGDDDAESSYVTRKQKKNSPKSRRSIQEQSQKRVRQG